MACSSPAASCRKRAGWPKTVAHHKTLLPRTYHQAVEQRCQVWTDRCLEEARCRREFGDLLIRRATIQRSRTPSRTVSCLQYAYCAAIDVALHGTQLEQHPETDGVHMCHKRDPIGWELSELDKPRAHRQHGKEGGADPQTETRRDIPRTSPHLRLMARRTLGTTMDLVDPRPYIWLSYAVLGKC